MGCGSSKVSCSVISLPHILTQRESKSKQKEDVVKKVSWKVTPIETYKMKFDKLNVTQNDLNQADLVAHETSTSVTSLEELSSLLCDGFRNNALKVRCIWRWIVERIQYYDVNSRISSPTIEILDQFLANKYTSPSEYADLMKTLLNNAGITCESVKGWTYSNEMEVINHIWNAVLLEDTWWLVDLCYSAGYFDKDKKFIKEVNESYFFSDPGLFILDHYPEDHRWQCLNNSITREIFENYAYFTRTFFKLRMKPLTHQKKVILADTNKIRLKFRTHKDIPILCTGKIFSKISKTSSDVVCYNTEKILHVNVVLGNDSEYTLELYAKNDNDVLSEKYELISAYDVKSSQLKKVVTEQAMQHPLKRKKWLPGFYLFHPNEGVLHINSTYPFKMSLPGAIALALCLGGSHSSWIAMENIKGTLWVKDVFIPNGVERVTIVGKFKDQGSQNNTYTSILEYRVK